jgi:hypothetical protein
VWRPADDAIPTVEARMSRLDSSIRRLEAQRSSLNMAAARVRRQAGIVLELGLGNGRTYDHLRELLPHHRIVVFERAVNAHVACRPPAEDLIVGELGRTLREAGPGLAGSAVLAHSDLGCGDPGIDRATASLVSEGLPPLLKDGALVVSDQPLRSPSLMEQALPAGVTAGRYFIYAKAAASRP